MFSKWKSFCLGLVLLIPCIPKLQRDQTLCLGKMFYWKLGKTLYIRADSQEKPLMIFFKRYLEMACHLACDHLRMDFLLQDITSGKKRESRQPVMLRTFSQELMRHHNGQYKFYMTLCRTQWHYRKNMVLCLMSVKGAATGCKGCSGLGEHYSDVTMSVMALQIVGIWTVCSVACPGAHQRKHQSSASLAFVKGTT